MIVVCMYGILIMLLSQVCIYNYDYNKYMYVYLYDYP